MTCPVAFTNTPIRQFVTRRAVDPATVGVTRCTGASLAQRWRSPCKTCRQDPTLSSAEKCLQPRNPRRQLAALLACPHYHDTFAHRGASTRAVVPEAPGPGRIGVIPAHARRGRGTCPGRSRRRRHDTDRGTGCDRATHRPSVPTGTRPADTTAVPTRPHDRAGPHHGGTTRNHASARPHGDAAVPDRDNLRDITRRVSMDSERGGRRKVHRQ